MKSTTAQKTQRIIEKEGKELKRLNKKIAKGSYAGYFAVILFLIGFVNVIDEITSSLPTYMQSSFVTDFLVNTPFMGVTRTFEEALSLHSIISAVSYVFGIVTPFYKALADRFGRKPLFVVSTLGMSLGMLLVFVSTNYATFLLGSAIMGFFIGHDIQIIYILEEAPSKHRAKIYSVLKALGILGSVAIPALRSSIMGNDPEKWRLVFLAPGIVGLFATVMVILFARETKIFLKERSEYLAIPFEERQAEKERKAQAKKADSKNTGVFSGIKYIFRNADTRALIIVHIVFDIAIAAVGLYHESAMHISGMSTAQITKALYVIPFVYATCVFLSGIIADALGRKKTILFFSMCNVVFLILFVIGLAKHLNPYFIGFCAGVYQAGYWIGRDYMDIMMTEKVPTEIRASVVGAEGLLVCAGMAIGYVVMTAGILVIPVSTMLVIITVPCVSASAIALMFRVKETKGVNLAEIPKE